MKAGTVPAEHTSTTPLVRSEDPAGETKNMRPTTSPSARGNSPRGIATTLLPSREHVKRLDRMALDWPCQDEVARSVAERGAKLSEQSGTFSDDPFSGRRPTSHERMSGVPWDASYHGGTAPWDI